MRARIVLTIGLALALMAPSGAAQAKTVKVYSSLPLSGASRPQTQAIVRGARLALEERGGVAGAHRVRYVSLDDATRAVGSWTPRRVLRNARRAVHDRSTIGYIGAFNSGASAVAMPYLSRARIPQISPSNTYIGLTRGGPGTTRREPGRYFPRARHYFRLAPNDRVQAAALATAMRNAGCGRIASVADREVYGGGVGALTRRHARKLGLRVVATHKVRPRSPARRLGRVVRARPDCVAYTGITANGAVRIVRVLGRRLPGARFFGSDGIAETGFTRRIPAGVASRFTLTVSTLAPGDYPAAGQAFFQRYAQRYSDPTPDPYAIYGYEAMQLILDAVAVAGPKRRAVIKWLRSVSGRSSVLGTYGFDRFGDTTQRTYGLYRISGGLLIYAGAVEAAS